MHCVFIKCEIIQYYVFISWQWLKNWKQRLKNTYSFYFLFSHFCNKSCFHNLFKNTIEVKHDICKNSFALNNVFKKSSRHNALYFTSIIFTISIKETRCFLSFFRDIYFYIFHTHLYRHYYKNNTDGYAFQNL